MRYWWVNHKQTWKQEIEGGFLWSPKTAKNGRKNQGYTNMTRVSPGDRVFSYAGGKIAFIGTVSGPHLEQKKPDFGNHGESWSDTGWFVPVEWEKLEAPIRPADHIEAIRDLLPELYSPIRHSNGHGNQGIYLAEISHELSGTIFELLGIPSLDELDQKQVAEDLESARIEDDSNLSPTEKSQLIMARRGQGKFKQNLRELEQACRVSGTHDQRFLIASHIKPWSVSDHWEKLDGNNGLLLAPHIDKLFDSGYISFTDTGDILVADSTISGQLQSWHLDPSLNVGQFRRAQLTYLEFHRNHIFRSNPPAHGSSEITRGAAESVMA